jgi:hypothetical protein
VYDIVLFVMGAYYRCAIMEGCKSLSIVFSTNADMRLAFIPSSEKGNV